MLGDSQRESLKELSLVTLASVQNEEKPPERQSFSPSSSAIKYEDEDLSRQRIPCEWQLVIPAGRLRKGLALRIGRI